jgi:hypothetical protein
MLWHILLGALAFTGAVLAQQEADPSSVQYTDQGCVLVMVRLRIPLTLLAAFRGQAFTMRA